MTGPGIKKNRAKPFSLLAAWMLVGILVLPYAIQAVHWHRYCGFTVECAHSDDCGNDAESGHDRDTCPVCRFHLAPYIEVPENVPAHFMIACGFELPPVFSSQHISPVTDITTRGPPRTGIHHI